MQPADIESDPVPGDRAGLGADQKMGRSADSEDGFEAAPINVSEAGEQTAEHRGGGCGAEADFNHPPW